MTMIQIVRQLQSQGHSINFHVRSDGGILIRSIDGMHYSGATGNAVARQMVGVEISKAREKQLKYATRARRIKAPSLDDELEKEYKRVKKLWSKAFKAKKGEPHPAGYFGKNRIKYAVKHYGREEALRRIREAEKYASGIAYSKNVEELAKFILSVANMYQSPELQKLSEDLVDNAYSIRDEWIKPAYDELYKLNAGVPPKEVARNTRKILRL